MPVSIEIGKQLRGTDNENNSEMLRSFSFPLVQAFPMESVNDRWSECRVILSLSE
jgi:hypothetical protein